MFIRLSVLVIFSFINFFLSILHQLLKSLAVDAVLTTGSHEQLIQTEEEPDCFHELTLIQETKRLFINISAIKTHYCNGRVAK